jgi:hypothetical protein
VLLNRFICFRTVKPVDPNLFNDTVSNSGYIASNISVISENKLGRMWKEAALCSFISLVLGKVIGHLLGVVVVSKYENFPSKHWRIKCPLYVSSAVRSFMARCLHALHSDWSGVR